MTTRDLIAAVHQFVADQLPGRTPRRILIYTVEDGADPIALPVVPLSAFPTARKAEASKPSPHE